MNVSRQGPYSLVARRRHEVPPVPDGVLDVTFGRGAQTRGAQKKDGGATDAKRAAPKTTMEWMAGPNCRTFATRNSNGDDLNAPPKN